MKMTKSELRASIKELSNENKELALSYLEKVYSPLIKLLQKEKIEKENFMSLNKNILDIFYNLLTEVYTNTGEKIASFYSDVKKFEIKDIFQITYRKDGKTLDDRVQSYLEDAYNRYIDGETNKSILDFLEEKFYILAINETAIVETAVKKNKIPLKATILVVEGGCTCGDGFCEEQAGEYPADEMPPCGELPPYHPGCDCTWYYEETDDIDDIKDLDIEPDEIGPIEVEVEE